MAAFLEPQRPTDSILEAFITRHQYLLQLERAAEEEQTRLLNSNCSPKLLERRGLALGRLAVSNVSLGLGDKRPVRQNHSQLSWLIYGNSLIELCRPLAYHTSTALPPHTFRNGDPVRIEAHVAPSGTKAKVKKKVGDGEDGAAVEGVVYKVSAEKVVVAVDGAKEADLPERVRLLKLANSVTFDRMDRTLAHLRRIVLPDETASISSTHSFNLPLIDVLLGIQQPSWRPQVPPVIPTGTGRKSETPQSGNEVEWLGENLNDSQKEAILFCLKAEHVACIHGPPGTGKTHTLIELIFQLLSRAASPYTTLPPRILVTTPSNLALDSLLLRLHALSLLPPYSSLLPPNSILRLGHPTRVHRDLVRETLDWKAANGDEGELLKDVGKELEGHLGDLGKKRGEKGSVKARDRGKRWEEVRGLRKEYRQREGKVVTHVVNSARVVLATCHSAGGKQLNNLQFDVCIIDEATQAVEAVCWVPVLKSKKLILAGDPQQLPPTILSKNEKTAKLPCTRTNGHSNKNGETNLESSLEETSIEDNRPQMKPPRTLERTLFDRLERLYGPAIKRVLQVQYRMNEHIAYFPSETLYDNLLMSDASVAKRTLLSLPSMSDQNSEEAKETLEPTVVFFDTAGCEFFERSESDSDGDAKLVKGVLGEGSKSNENEAVVVAKWARKLVSLGVPADGVAVVTPYQAQVSLISSMLREDYPEMTIGSVDGLQGQEREAIILSLVRSSPTGEVGFLGEYRRLNVAMTRAKRQLCVVGDSATVGKGSKYLEKWMAWLEANADVRWAGEEVI